MKSQGAEGLRSRGIVELKSSEVEVRWVMVRASQYVTRSFTTTLRHALCQSTLSVQPLRVLYNHIRRKCNSKRGAYMNDHKITKKYSVPFLSLTNIAATTL